MTMAKIGYCFTSVISDSDCAVALNFLIINDEILSSSTDIGTK